MKKVLRNLVIALAILPVAIALVACGDEKKGGKESVVATYNYTAESVQDIGFHENVASNWATRLWVNVNGSQADMPNYNNNEGWYTFLSGLTTVTTWEGVTIPTVSDANGMSTWWNEVASGIASTYDDEYTEALDAVEAYFTDAKIQVIKNAKGNGVAKLITTAKTYTYDSQFPLALLTFASFDLGKALGEIDYMVEFAFGGEEVTATVTTDYFTIKTTFAKA